VTSPTLAGHGSTGADLAPLLAPLGGELPGGEWLRLDPVYDEIKRRRSEEDAALPQGVWQRELKRADWAGTAELCAEVLATRSKDLQVGAWLTEAWLQLEGFPGLERGVRLLAGLCRAYWAELNPPLDEDGADARLSPLAWMADRLPRRLKAVAVTAPAGEDALPYGWADWEAGRYLGNLALVDAAEAAKGEERGMVPQPKFLISASLTPAAWFVGLGSQTAGALAALDDLGAALAERCGEAAPSLTPLKEPLLAVQSFAARIVEERRQKGELPGVGAGGGESEADGDAPADPTAPTTLDRAAATAPSGADPPGRGSQRLHGRIPAAGAITSRAQAYEQLGAAADYLLRAEPHSPVPYLVRRAVSWGNLSLAELLEELLAKNADLATIYTLLGIKRPG
jgi:type VI secretion system protein ImpA